MAKEFRVTCKSCGNVSYHSTKDLWGNVGKAFGNAGKSFAALGGSPFGARKNDPLTDYSKCPNCGSRNITKEVVEY